MNSLTLAYIGDAVYELYIREYLINKKIVKVNDLQKESIKYVSATNQSNILHDLLDKNFFNEKELDIIKRARNHKGNRHPKNTDIITYKHATAFEAIIGYLYLNDKERLNELMKVVL